MRNARSGSRVGCAKKVPVPGGMGVRSAHPVSVTEVVKLSQAGVEPDVIVYKMNLSGLVYTLTDEQCTQIRQRGVTPRVIDTMHGTYDQALAKHPKLAQDKYLACWYLGWDGAWYGRGPNGFHAGCR
jgi:hypothetical protein